MSHFDTQSSTCTAFAGTRRIASGDLPDVAANAKTVFDRLPWEQILIFDDVSSETVEIDFRGTVEDVVQRLRKTNAEPAAESPIESPIDNRKPGRPRLGVVAREVTLLPRHWEWLAAQPGGASVALRKLVEQARLANKGIDRRRRAQESAYRFLSAMAGNEPNYEEALRALFANQQDGFNRTVEDWPKDVRDHARRLAAPAFAK